MCVMVGRQKVQNEGINIGELLVTSAVTIDPHEPSRVELNANFHDKTRIIVRYFSETSVAQ